ncbi:MAG: hypothetical protein ACTSRP_18280 [Candidatus Helarchaeota archaeon]
MESKRFLIKKAIGLVCTFFLGILISWIFFESIELIYNQYTTIVFNVIFLTICIFIQIFMSKYLTWKVYFVIGLFLLTNGVLSIYVFSNNLFTALVFGGYIFFINSFWNESFRASDAKNLTLIIIVSSFLFGLCLKNLITMLTIEFFSQNIVWTLILVFILSVYLLYWYFSDTATGPISQNITNADYTLNFHDKYRINLSVIQSIQMGGLMFLIITCISNNFYSTYVNAGGNLFYVVLNIIIMGIISIISVLYSNFSSNVTPKTMKWLYDVYILLIIIAIMLEGLLFFIDDVYYLIFSMIIGAELVICLFISFIIQKEYNFVWWIGISLIIIFGGFILNIFFDIIVSNFTILIVQLMSLFYGRNLIINIIPALNMVENEK